MTSKTILSKDDAFSGYWISEKHISDKITVGFVLDFC